MESQKSWKPHQGPQETFLRSDVYEVGFGGAKGPGKTEVLLLDAVQQVNNPRYRAVIFRRTYPRLGEVIDRSFRYFPALGAKFSGRDTQLEIPAWTFPSGAKIGFGHIQNETDKFNWQGKEIHYIGFDQLEEFTENQYLFLIAQNRTSDKDISIYIRSTFNPGGVGHVWVKKRFIDSMPPNTLKYFKRIDDDDIECTKDDPHGLPRIFIPAVLTDNPTLLDNDPDYIRRLEALPEAEKRAFRYGDWDVFAGQFFEMWRNHTHVKEKEIPKNATRFISLDYGYAKPSCALWWAVDYDENLYCYRELYAEGLTYQKLGQLIRERSGEESISYLVADPAIWGDKARHKGSFIGESGAETLQIELKGFTTVIKADNNRLTGWVRLRTLLKPELGQHGQLEPRILFHPSCTNTIRTIPGCVRDERKPEDLNTEGEDHAADSTRYAAMSRPDVPEKRTKIEQFTEDWWEDQEERQRERELD